MKVYSKLILFLFVFFISVKAYSKELISAAKESAMDALISLDTIDVDTLSSDNQIGYYQTKEKIHNVIFQLDQIPQRFVKTMIWYTNFYACDDEGRERAKEQAQEAALGDCEAIYDSCKITSVRIIPRQNTHCIAQAVAVPER
jgi:hypothetical protein